MLQAKQKVYLSLRFIKTYNYYGCELTYVSDGQPGKVNELPFCDGLFCLHQDIMATSSSYLPKPNYNPQIKLDKSASRETVIAHT